MPGSKSQTDLPHVEAYFDSATSVWSEPVVVENPYINLHPLASGSSFGQQCFEGLKAFRGIDDRVRIFRPRDHAARFNISATYVSLPPVPEALFLKAANLAVLAGLDSLPPGSTHSLYLRPILTGVTPNFAPVPSERYAFFVYVGPLAAYMGTEPITALLEEGFDRAAPKGTGAAKIAGNYAPLMPWASAAKAKGFDTTLHLDALTHSHIEEFATTAFIGIKGGLINNNVTLVVSDSDTIIKSITAHSCVEIALRMGWRVEVRPIHVNELPYFDEVLAAGTAATACTVSTIFREATGQTFTFTADGEVSFKIRQILQGIQFGETEDVYGHTWLVESQDVMEPGLWRKHDAEPRPHM